MGAPFASRKKLKLSGPRYRGMICDSGIASRFYSQYAKIALAFLRRAAIREIRAGPRAKNIAPRRNAQ
jgi:hypothetical protein